MSRPGAADTSGQERPRRADRAEPPRTDSSAESLTDDFFIPDFCAPRTVFAVVLIAELIAFTLSLARPAAPFLMELARLSLFLQWLGLTSAALLCAARPRLRHLSVPWASAAVLLLLLVNTTVISEIAIWLSRGLDAGAIWQTLFPRDRGSFVLRNIGICAIVAAVLLRYFFVSHQWRRQVRAEARSRIEALQARIRPHFLFNSMNTIAALTRSDPARAEEAVEDLADLFRATLRDSQSPLRLKEELELTRIYQRIEAQRLGERLVVDWQIDDLPMRALIPSLTLQPLLENAIYHGIEPLPHGGTVTVSGAAESGRVRITVANPLAATPSAEERPGNRLALENIRQRLWLAYGERGALQIEREPDEYRVTIRFPHEE